MKNKSDLKRKVLCSLLAASTMGIFYSSDALAASVNGVNPDLNNDGIITDAELIGLKDSEDNNVGSKKFVIAQGDKLVIATEGNVNSLIKDIQAANGDLNAIRKAIADHSVVGVIGGEGQLDSGLKGILENLQQGDITSGDTIYDLADGKWGMFVDAIIGLDVDGTAQKIGNIDTIENNNISGDTNLIIGGVENEAGKIVSPVVIGAIGGDLSVNTGLNGSFNVNTGDNEGSLKQEGNFTSNDTSIERHGNVNIVVDSGNVIGGVGGSAAITVGNISFDLPEGKFGGLINANAHLQFDGKTTTTIDGNVNTWVNNGANVGGFANGGSAMAIGGLAESTVKGDTKLIIDSVVDMDGAVDGVVAGASGGGLAVTTIGGTANSIVEGDSNISINNGLAGGIIGGGIAASVDATGVVEVITNDQKGNDAGYVDITGAQLEDLLGMSIPDDMTIIVDNAVQGGEATANVKGDTRIELTGNTTALGVIGGGIAAATHTYTWKGDKTFTDDTQDVNDAYGSSTATANTGKATIVVNLESADPDNVAANIGGALSGIIDAVKGGDLSEIDTDGVVGQGAAVGVFGGGVAFGHGSLRSTIDAESEGAYAVANNEGGADIILNKGYAAGVFGGGAAGTLNNAKAETNTGAVNTYVGKEMKAVGLFGGGFAVSMEGEKSDDNYKGSTNGTLASSNVASNNIEVYGDVDGIYGGGMAIGNSVLNSSGASDAVTHVGTTNITVNSGTIDRLQLISIMNASKNDNENGYPQWDVLGVNASMAMSDLKGITDNTSIAAGGMALGMTGSDTVDVANITINGGEVTKDILGGGIAVDNMKEGSGAHVGTSTITLNGGTVDGSIYAGGAINGTTPCLVDDVYNTIGYDAGNTSSTVENATVVLNGATVEGEISGQGYKMTTKYGKNNNFNPFYDNNSLSYEKDVYESVTNNSTLILKGNNTLKQLDENGDYTGTSKIHSFDNVNVTADSVTTLDSSLEAGNTVALIDAKLSDTVNGLITVADGAKLDVSQLTADKDNAYLVASNYAKDSTFWSNDALLYDRTENYADAINGSDGYKVSYKDLADLTEAEQDKAVNDFVDSLGEGGDNFEGTANGIIRNGENTNAGAKDFFGDYTKGEGTSRDLAAMAMIGEAAGVTSNTIDVAGDMADNSVLRLSFTQDDITGEPKVNEDGAIWAKYIHNKHDLDGMASSFGSVDSSSDFDGATIGVDFAKKGKVQSGIAFSYGSGDSHGMGINNDFDMWGVSLYGNVKNDDTNVIADIGFSESDNELTGNAMGKDIKADRDVSVFTVGVRAEKLYTNGSTQIVPYTGLRYYNVDPDSYTAYYDGQKFGEYDADRQNIWTLPVGVSLRNETVTESGWRLTPKVDVAYIWAFGDTDNSFDLNTGSGVDTLDYTVMDSGSWLGSVGFEAGKDDWAFGVGYSYQKGSHEEANKWFVNVEYSF